MSFKKEVQQGERFEFGKNWQSFRSILTEDRLVEAEKSICEFLEVRDLKGKRFLDIGSGSGLFSLAARRLGAEVLSFDFDPQSVECTRALRKAYFPDDPNWIVTEASILDPNTMEFGEFDICYAWGVLHHTGSLWQALYNASQLVSDGGFLFIGIYNDQGMISAIWNIVKHVYCSGRLAKALVCGVFYPLFFLSGLFLDIIRLRNPTRRYKEHKKYRGMSLVHDWKDWLGGLPYEVASPNRIVSFFENLGFELQNSKPTQHGFGNNQFLLKKLTAEAKKYNPRYSG